MVWQLAFRFRKSKKRSGFTSFIASSSTVGIGLGCFVLILLLSVMNGFERELKDRLLVAIPHGELTAVDPAGLADWKSIIEQAKRHPQVVSAQPFIKATALLQRGKKTKAVELTAIDPALSHQNEAAHMVNEEAWQTFIATPYGVLLGRKVLKQLGLSVGDKVQALLPRRSEPGSSDGLKLSAPETIWLTVVGEVSLGGELDSFLAYMHMDLAAETLSIAQGAQGIRLNYVEPFDARMTTRRLAYELSQQVYISDWTRTHGHLYQDIQLVRSVVYLALILVIAVASFNIVSSLVMSVSEKQAEIAMLKTMGARSNLIARVFILQGSLNGVIGALFGSVSGILVALNLSDIAKFIESLFGVKLLSGDIYFIDFLPSLLLWRDVWITVSISLLLSVLATIYPALRASKVEPAKVLGH
ncbi:lipoprotein-releasing ABC transporter permease subunit [Paraneptunicella aestuarii]|nr:lipoprotein-releasing ABC transporter permease subunit [Paraneptunicella aestuarii]